jgi:predicted RNA-binding Zn ribbon-like protein
VQPLTSYTGVMQGQPGDKALPAGLDAVQDFLNTLDERSFSRHGTWHSGGDELATGASLAAWLTGRGLITSAMKASSDDLAAAIALREALRSALKLRADGATAELALSQLNAVLATFPLQVRLGTRVTPELVPAGNSTRAGLAAIAAAVALSEAAGTWKRLKICAALDCRWVFYDTSRSGAGRWCSMRVCGNRDKTRAYRQRHR